MRFGLKEEVIERINGVFRSFPCIDEVILYGSRAKGNFKPGSDIDLTVKGERIDLSTLYKIERELDDLMLPYKIDLSIWSQIDNPDLLEHIQRVGKMFYSCGQNKLIC
jgi:predicted nucleotidyltransferase